MDILGINAFHGDSAAALVRSGALVAGVEEERLRRIKHWAGFPDRAIGSVLATAGGDVAALEHVAVSRDPSAHLLNKVLHTLRRRPDLGAVRARLSNHQRVRDLPARVAGLPNGRAFRGRIHNVEHHRAHLASAFFCSPFEEAACLTVDGFGDFLSSMSAIGRGNHLEICDEVEFPHSLGILYSALTQYLGFPKYGDEYKVMGLAAYGEPRLLPQLRPLLSLTDDGRFKLALDFFNHASEGVTMAWDEGEPSIGPLFSQKLVATLGPARRPDQEIGDVHRDLAASLQALYEEAFFHRLAWLQRRSGLTRLCLAGGCAMNSVANGKIFRRSGFEEVFIQPAAGDAGTSLGAALYVWHEVLERPRGFVMSHSYWGPEHGEPRVVEALASRLAGFDAKAGRHRAGELEVARAPDETTLLRETARALAAGEIVGWYQGRCEWGPRALGNRSILADPRRADIRSLLNERIKRRESFRPFAPSILEERVGDYFEESYPDPFMCKVYPIRPSRRAEIPAVTHVDGSGRLQTVSSEQNPRYWRLIRAFEAETGVPLVLNTSFNENEPIVNLPEEALDCFLRTRMDRLVLGDWVLSRSASSLTD